MLTLSKTFWKLINSTVLFAANQNSNWKGEHRKKENTNHARERESGEEGRDEETDREMMREWNKEVRELYDAPLPIVAHSELVLKDEAVVANLTTLLILTFARHDLKKKCYTLKHFKDTNILFISINTCMIITEQD